MWDTRVLVTGGAGFIGSNLANYLADDNDVIALDDCYLGTPKNLDDRVEFVEASVLAEDLPTDVGPEYVDNPIPEDLYVEDTCADSSKMRAATSWEQRIDFEEGIERVCRQYT